ncbi:phospholipase D-like domain-containing protein [Coprobacter fastidiosus]|jgi:phosphatidylserine/phosphatidylglycerophosphate/cardiolipin synthase-like enzyme|uniref:phospholipase D-like domain-containing protein n=1 Tax=Coprobacter fastidiosus TaxID=1099853 RepID=UPI00241CC1C0|nr:phospholipase D-like domain-containing protein [Coprobacter fastidiosus]
MIQYVQNEQHYVLLMDEISKVRHTFWIGTADLKDLYVKQGRSAIPFLALLEKKIRQGVSIRLLHAKEPGKNFRNDFDKYPLLWERQERALCPRIHFKLMLFDLERAYIGSANLTGAAFGMKSKNNRNFEAGIFTDERELVEAAITQFDEVWMGKPCKTCGRKEVCKDRIIQI